MPEAEIEAITHVASALANLSDEERGRVLRWAADKYGVAVGNGRSRGVDGDEADDDEDDPDADAEHEHGSARTGRTFEHFAELYDAVGPSSDPERVLVAGYWMQVIEGKVPFGSQQVNDLLKELGHRVGSVNKAMARNMDKKPALILQVGRGSGNARQVRKKYKLSEAGPKWVREALG